MTQNYFVGPSGNKWQAKKPGSPKASGLFDTQNDAQKQAKQWAKNAGGGEVRVQGRDGKIRASDTMPNKKDNFPPRG